MKMVLKMEEFKVSKFRVNLMILWAKITHLLHLFSEIVVLWWKKLAIWIRIRLLRIQLYFQHRRLSRKLKKVAAALPEALSRACEAFDQFATVYKNIADEKEADQSHKTIIAVDFDGTICEDRWPKIGPINSELVLWLIWRQRNGANVVLWTCREGGALDEAIKVCESVGLYFDAVNDNLDMTVKQFSGRNPRKIYATEYIDDRNSTVGWKLPFHSINKK